jgi:BirA family biotin operon repressor/biotin-[acetyl-CoA-carboxylase] ligase
LCGILAETVETPKGRAVVVGVGINLTNKSFPYELISVATSVEAATGKSPDRDVVLEALVNCLAENYQLLQEPAGPEEIVAAWCASSSYAQGKRIRVADGDESLVGTTRGLECDGALRLEMDDGEIKIVRAGDVTIVRPISV